LTDPDSRSMATSGRGSGTVGYNVQLAVDTEHHLIARSARCRSPNGGHIFQSERNRARRQGRAAQAPERRGFSSKVDDFSTPALGRTGSRRKERQRV
jgi:hypothetical protein